MSITYQWTVESVVTIDSETHTSVIKEVRWQLMALNELEGINVFTDGTVELNISELSEFIEFDQLTEEQVLAWVKSSLGSEVEYQKGVLSNKIDKILAKQGNRTVSKGGLPWDPEEVVE